MYDERMRKVALVVVMVATAFADSSVPLLQIDAAVDEKIRALWRGLPKSKNGCPDDFDYFPDGGMRNFYCHLLPRVAMATIEKWAGVPIYASGGFNLKSTKSFGHYNPQFVRWLPALIPALRDETFRAVAQPIYDRKIKPLARTHYRVYRKLQADPAFLEREKKRLLKEMASARGATDTYERFYDYGSSAGDGNVAKTAVAFWIRRSIDGTDADFFAALEQLMKIHDPTMLKN